MSVRPTPSADGRRFRLPALVRDVPSTVILLSLAAGLLSCLYSVLLPIYQGPDEPQHVDLVLSLTALRGWPETPVSRTLSRRVQASQPIVQRRDYAEDPRGLDEAPPRGQRPTFEELPDNPPTVAVNHIAQHPPLYYAVTAGASVLVTSVLPGLSDLTFDQTVGLFRLGNSLLLVILPLLVYAAARRLELPHSASMTGVVLSLAIPQLYYVAGTVNNDVLLTITMSALALLLVYVITGDTSRSTAVMIGICSGLALLTKGFALLSLPLIAWAYLLATRSRYMTWRSAAERLVISGSVAMAVGGWWWVRNLVVHGDIQPIALQTTPAPTGFRPDIQEFGWEIYRRLIAGFWGNFSLFDPTIPVILVVVSSVIGGILVVHALRHADEGSDGLDRRIAMFLLAPVLLLSVFLVATSWLRYVDSGSIWGIQGRYLYPGLVGLIIVVSEGGDRLLRRRGRGHQLPALAAAGAATLHATAIPLILMSYWGTARDNSPLTALRAMSGWSPWPTTWMILPTLGLVVTIGVATYQYVSEQRTASPPVGD